MCHSLCLDGIQDLDMNALVTMVKNPDQESIFK